MRTKILAALLAICCLVSLFASCGTNNKPTDTPKTEDPKNDGSDTDAPQPDGSGDTNETDGSLPKEDSEPEFIYETVVNPILPSGADPWVVCQNGKYYYCFAEGTTVSVSVFDGLNHITTDTRQIVYTAPAGTAYSSEYWAPELHYINGEWYIYVAADDGNNVNHRMYVLKGTSQNPLDPFEMVGKIADRSNKWAIDGTILEHKGELFFIWSGWEGDQNVAQNIYIAHMSDPCTIDSPRVLLSTPEYYWEKVGVPYVNEGPTALKNGDDTFIVYSASGSWTDDYCLGMLTLTGDNPLNPDHWQKSEDPVFKQRKYFAYGPGHCSFAPAADGSLWMIYHANRVSGTSWGGRSVWIAPITFAEDGTPIFGMPNFKVQYPVKNPDANT